MHEALPVRHQAPQYLLSLGWRINDLALAVAHYQFEAIHTFTDGNGRTGRVLNSLFLVEKELLEFPVLYLIRYVMARKAEYHRLLLQVTRDSDWEAWLMFLLRGVEETSHPNRKII